MKHFFIALLLASVTTATFSQSLQLKEVEITSGLETKTMSSTPETTIKGKYKIDSLNNFTETGFFLRNFANNITTTSDGSGLVGYNYYKIRGIDNPRINFTLNGVPLNDQLDGWTFLSNLPDFTNNIDGVQVQYGVGTSTYGLAPIAGSVHFKSSVPSDVAKTSLEYSLGSFGLNRYSVSNNTGLINGKFKFTNRFSNMYTDGFRDNSAFRGKTFYSSGGYYTTNNELTYTFLTGDIESNMAYIASPLEEINRNYRHNPLSRQRDNFNQSLFMVSNKHTTGSWKNESSLYVNGVYGNFDLPMDWNTQAPPFYKVFTNGTNLGVYTINTFTLSKNSLFKSGTNIIHSNRIQSFDSLGTDFYSNRNTKTQVSQFLKYEVNFSGFDFYADLEGRFVQMGYRDQMDNTLNFNNNWVFFNPKFGITRKMGNFVTYFSFAQVTREPYRLDMLSGHDDVRSFNSDPFIGRTFDMTTVKPERVNDYEGGVRFFNNIVNGSVNLYYMDFVNEIVPVGVISPLTSLPVRVNVDRSYRRGVEVNLFKQISLFNLSSNINYNESVITNFVDNTDLIVPKNTNVINNRHLLSPTWVIRNNVSANYKNQKLTLTHNYVSDSYLSNTNDNRFILPQYNIVGIRLDTKHKNFDLFLVVDNLLDARYFTSGVVGLDYNGIPNSNYFVQPTRNFLAGVKASF